MDCDPAGPVDPIRCVTPIKAGMRPRLRSPTPARDPGCVLARDAGGDDHAHPVMMSHAGSGWSSTDPTPGVR